MLSRCFASRKRASSPEPAPVPPQHACKCACRLQPAPLKRPKVDHARRDIEEHEMDLTERRHLISMKGDWINVDPSQVTRVLSPYGRDYDVVTWHPWVPLSCTHRLLLLEDAQEQRKWAYQNGTAVREHLPSDLARLVGSYLSSRLEFNDGNVSIDLEAEHRPSGAQAAAAAAPAPSLASSASAPVPARAPSH